MDPFPFEVQRQTGVARAVLAQRGTVPTSFPVGHWLFFPPPYGAIPRNIFPTERYDERPGVAGQRGGWIHSRKGEFFFAAIGPFAGVVIIVMLIAAAIGLCWAAFLINPLTVGRNRYFMESRQSATPFSTVTSIFRTPYLNVVKVMLLTNLKIALGSLLIIPGIYWSYCYMQVGYLMAENPYLTTCRAMELSKQMMDGEKWNTFVLQLSFIGWYLLCSITFGIGFIFLEPYVQATFAELYAALRAKALANGYTNEYELGGFVRH